MKTKTTPIPKATHILTLKSGRKWEVFQGEDVYWISAFDGTTRLARLHAPEIIITPIPVPPVFRLW